MDTIDRQLIQILQEDASLSYQTLAKQLDVSASTVRRRVKNLIRNGIMCIVARVNPAKAGLSFGAIIAFDVAYNNLDSAMQTLDSYPEIKWSSTTTGRFDMIVFARFGSGDDLNRFLHDVARIEGLKDSETFVCLHMGKEMYTKI